MAYQQHPTDQTIDSAAPTVHTEEPRAAAAPEAPVACCQKCRRECHSCHVQIGHGDGGHRGLPCCGDCCDAVTAAAHELAAAVPSISSPDPCPMCHGRGMLAVYRAPGWWDKWPCTMCTAYEPAVDTDFIDPDVIDPVPGASVRRPNPAPSVEDAPPGAYLVESIVADYGYHAASKDEYGHWWYLEVGSPMITAPRRIIGTLRLYDPTPYRA